MLCKTCYISTGYFHRSHVTIKIFGLLLCWKNVATSDCLLFGKNGHRKVIGEELASPARKKNMNARFAIIDFLRQQHRQSNLNSGDMIISKEYTTWLTYHLGSPVIAAKPKLIRAHQERYPNKRQRRSTQYRFFQNLVKHDKTRAFTNILDGNFDIDSDASTIPDDNLFQFWRETFGQPSEVDTRIPSPISYDNSLANPISLLETRMSLKHFPKSAPSIDGITKNTCCLFPQNHIMPT